MADFFSNYAASEETSTSSITPSPATAVEKKPSREQPRIRRRNRLITSCLECRRRKLKCDKQQPCTNCTKFSRDCVFLAPALDSAGQAKLAEVKEKMGMLERALEEDVARRKTFKHASASRMLTSPPLPGQEQPYSDQEEPEDEKDLEPTDLAVEDAAYFEDDGNDDLVDLGIQMGKIRITERIGGLVRPRLSEELAQALKDIPKHDDQNPFKQRQPGDWMAPGSNYVAPSSSFFFAPGVEKTSLMNFLPSKVLTDKLIEHYWKAVHIIARTVHRPTFERQYDQFWRDINAGIEPKLSFQAVVLAALLSSVISMSEERVLNEFGVSKAGLVENFKQGTEAALARANFLRTTKLETLQAFVMYLIPLCRSEISRAHSALTGTCIRLAECMGLHRDPTHYTSSPVEIQIRRLIWYQICFLDLRTCEATGPRPQIRNDEFDARFPLNIDDTELERCCPGGPKEDAKHFTDMTISKMRFECYEMHRLIWTERVKVERRETTLTSVLKRIQNFRKAMEERYLPMMNRSNPLHVIAMEIYGLLSDRMYIMTVQKFASNGRRVMPERLRQMMISASVRILEHSMNMEQVTALAPWSWYVGALHQYHTALLLLNELYVKPPDPNINVRVEPAVEARIWRCIDYVFELPSGLSPREKSRMVLKELVERTGMYQTMRRVRAPTSMTQPYEQPPPAKQASTAQSDRERSSSVHSSLSGYTAASGQSGGHGGQQQQQEQQQQQQQQHLGGYQASLQHEGIPNYDFGLGVVEMGTADPSGLPVSAPATHEQSAYNIAGFSPVNQSLIPSVGHGSETSSTAGNMSVMGSGPGSSGTGGSPLEAMPDIDWNEFDQLFGAFKMPAADILIPPFSFPPFSPQDLQWGQGQAEGLH